MPEVELEVIETCTGCGAEAFMCVVGNCDPTDLFDGPYGLCEQAYDEWLDAGEIITLIHD